jgi:hypothetical protein
MGVGFAIVLYRRLSGRYTPEMRAFDLWMKISNPDKFKLPPDPDPRFEHGYKEAVSILKTTPKAIRHIIPRALLQFFREHPDYGAPGDVFARHFKRVIEELIKEAKHLGRSH